MDVDLRRRVRWIGGATFQIVAYDVSVLRMEKVSASLAG